MGSGIVSIGLLLDGQASLSHALLAIAGVAWIAAVLLLARHGIPSPRILAGDPAAPGALTIVAGTAVLGSGIVLLGWIAIAIILLSVAVLLWLVLVPPVVAGLEAWGAGISLMPVVATQSLAVMTADLAPRARSEWLLDLALATFLVGLASYAIIIARFDPRQLTAGRGDQWIAGGALGISALAAATIVASAEEVGALSAIVGPLKDASVVLWALTIAWLPALLAGEFLKPRLDYEGERWSTVFPVGMYAACSFAVGTAANIPAIADFARVWIWVALGVWAVVFVAMIRSRS